MAATIHDLNYDVTVYIFSYLEVHERIRMRKVCRRYRELMDTEKTLQFDKLFLVDCREDGIDATRAGLETTVPLRTCIFPWKFLCHVDSFKTSEIRCEILKAIVVDVHCHERSRRDFISEAVLKSRTKSRYMRSCQILAKAGLTELVNSVHELRSLFVESCWLIGLEISNKVKKSLDLLSVRCGCISNLPMDMVMGFTNLRSLCLNNLWCRHGELAQLQSLPSLTDLYLGFAIICHVRGALHELFDAVISRRQLTRLELDYPGEDEEELTQHGTLEKYVPQCDFMELTIPWLHYPAVERLLRMYRTLCPSQHMVFFPAKGDEVSKVTFVSNTNIVSVCKQYPRGAVVVDRDDGFPMECHICKI
jgi:hypothetical protein